MSFLENIKLKAVLARGPGSYLYLCKDCNNDTNNLMCLKVISKSQFNSKFIPGELASFNMVKHSPLFVKLFDHHETINEMYFLMEYLPSGDLLTLFNNSDNQPFEYMQFCAAQLVVAIEFLHKHLIIHRDIKLENVLRTGSGHVKLCDYGTYY